MKKVLIPLSAIIAFSGPAFAETSVQELFAMSNDSAAEIIVQETSMGDVMAAEIKLALGNMSAAERMTFFESDMATRMELIKKKQVFGDSDSAAEMRAVLDRQM